MATLLTTSGGGQELPLGPLDFADFLLDNNQGGISLARWSCDACCAKALKEPIVCRGIGLCLSIDLDVGNAEDSSTRSVGKPSLPRSGSNRLEFGAIATFGTRRNFAEVETSRRSTTLGVGFPIFPFLVIPATDETELLGYGSR